MPYHNLSVLSWGEGLAEHRWAVNRGVVPRLPPEHNPSVLSWGEGLAEHRRTSPVLRFGQKRTPTVDVLYSPPELPSRRLFLFVCISRITSVDIDARV